MKHLDLNKTLLEILNKRTTRSFNVGKCKLTLHSLDGKMLGLQGVRLEARDRGKGEATRALLALFDAVDTLGVRVRLQVQPMDKKTNKTGLVRLYSRFGFKKFNDKASVGYFMMERKPQHKHTANEAHASKKENTGMSLKSIATKLAVAGVQTRMVIADSAEKFQVPPSISKAWKRDTSIEDFDIWEWKPVRNHRVTVSGKPGKLKISTFNIPAPGSWVLDVDGKFSKLGTERRFATLKEAVKSFVIAYNHYKPE